MPAPRPRPRCAYRLDYGGHTYCKFAWKTDIMAEAKELHHGCPVNCEDYHAAFPAENEPQVEKSKDGA